SFPRTGSHWFRMILELYSDRPLLTRSFFKHSNKDYLLLHTHDMNLSEQRKNVIYLYRYPTDVIFSQLNYYGQPTDNDFFIRFWTNQYSHHLIHWLFLEEKAEKKLVISYEQMRQDICMVYKKVCEHLNLEFDKERLQSVAKQIDKEKVATKTRHDPQVINKGEDYQYRQTQFKTKYDSLVMNLFAENSNTILGNKEKLLAVFS
ncbi:MAG: sulfotransferase domain-containing protein, partial [Bacteroidota bacterium]